VREIITEVSCGGILVPQSKTPRARGALWTAPTSHPERGPTAQPVRVTAVKCALSRLTPPVVVDHPLTTPGD
jgi:hypothetical protein